MSLLGSNVWNIYVISNEALAFGDRFPRCVDGAPLMGSADTHYFSNMTRTVCMGKKSLPR